MDLKGASDKYIFYIDESGVMDTKHIGKGLRYFVICLVRIIDKNVIKRTYKSIFKQHKSEDIKWEMHGCKFRKGEKWRIVDQFIKPGALEVYYILVDNSKIIEEDLYINKALAFNYLLDRNFLALLKSNKINKGEYELYIDNRNVAVKSYHSLEDYLTISLKIQNKLIDNIKVEYCDSKEQIGVQIADIFSNVFFSYLMNPKGYIQLIKKLEKNKIIKSLFRFPLTNYR